MKDYLLDIVKHTHALGFIESAKVTGTDTETKVEAVSEDRAVMIKAHFHKPVADFVGTVGMPNLGNLNTILNIPEYAEDNAKLTITRSDTGPSNIRFENVTGDFKIDYRFMKAEIVTEMIKSITFKGAKWGVETAPTVAAINRLKFMASANNHETMFVAKTEDDNLKFYFGDPSTHAGDFVFAHNVDGVLTKGWNWPVAAFISILSLEGGDKMVRFSDEGAAEITVDSGLGLYHYYMPAQRK